MTNEEFERKINIMAEQQAQFAAEFDQKHQLWKAEMERNFERIARSQADTESILNRLARVTNEGFKDVNAKINALVDSQIRMEDEQRKTDEQLRKNAEQQRITDEQLRKTDEILRRHLGGKRNGQE